MTKVALFPPMRQRHAPVASQETLEAFVRESNAIENIWVGPGDPLWDDHMAATDLVSRTAKVALLDPQTLHKAIMRSQPEHTPGDIRTGWVTVGGRLCPDPILAAHLLINLKAKVDMWVGQDDPPSEADIWDWHHEFERVHPFSDGNGRTGRLWLNSVRAHFGYAWIVIEEAYKEEYYAQIVEYIRRTFGR